MYGAFFCRAPQPAGYVPLSKASTQEARLVFGAEGGSRLVCLFVDEQSFLSVVRPEEGSFGVTPLLLKGGRELLGKVLRLMAPPY